MPNTRLALLSTSYLPPIQYFSKFLYYEKVYIEIYENYQKQSYRNRCVIYAANGPLTLVVPVIKKQGVKTKISDIKIDYSKSWQRMHWRSIVSAYKNSPFFEFFEEKFVHFYENNARFLVDLNMSLLKTVLEIFEVDTFPEFTKVYQIHGNFDDYRHSINPKKRLAKPDNLYEVVPYHQVFNEKFGFIPNLSIIDLLFNMGTESTSMLKNSIKKGI